MFPHRRRQKVDGNYAAHALAISSEAKKMRMPANVKTYDGTGDPDDHLKIFESAATIENWPQPVWCHMFNSTLVGNARNCGVQKRLRERYKDECIHVKACPEILKISGFMNGINNPELIKRLNDRVPQTFDELMKRTSYRCPEGRAGNDKYTPLTMTPKEILATERANFPKTNHQWPTPEEQTRVETDTGRQIGSPGHHRHIMALLEDHNLSDTDGPHPLPTGMLKFPFETAEIVTIYNTAAPPKECNTVTCDVTSYLETANATKVFTNLKVAIHLDYPEQEVSIGGSLSDTGRAAVCALLQETSISLHGNQNT
ncbi:hypothetical protein Tco_1283922 [Tanacetum coccineum]